MHEGIVLDRAADHRQAHVSQPAMDEHRVSQVAHLLTTLLSSTVFSLSVQPRIANGLLLDQHAPAKAGGSAAFFFWFHCSTFTWLGAPINRSSVLVEVHAVMCSATCRDLQTSCKTLKARFQADRATWRGEVQ